MPAVTTINEALNGKSWGILVVLFQTYSFWAYSTYIVAAEALSPEVDIVVIHCERRLQPRTVRTVHHVHIPLPERKKTLFINILLKVVDG